jgi:hypothetical protein
MSDIVHVIGVEPLDGLCIRASFSDGAVKEIDLSGLFDDGGVFEPIRRSRAIFTSVRVNPETGTVEWPGEVDLDSEVLYGRFEPASGAPISRRTLREPASVGNSGAAA